MGKSAVWSVSICVERIVCSSSSSNVTSSSLRKAAHRLSAFYTRGTTARTYGEQYIPRVIFPSAVGYRNPGLK